MRSQVRLERSDEAGLDPSGRRKLADFGLPDVGAAAARSVKGRVRR